MITIKIYNKKDIDFILKLFSNPNNRLYQITKTITRDNAFGLTENNKNKSVYAIKLNNEIIGFCMLKKLLTEPEIGMSIEEEHWGKGYGKKVLKLLEKKAKKIGIKNLKLSVDIKNTRAIKLYDHQGYNTFCKDKFFLKMKKMLN